MCAVHAKCLGFDQDALPRVPESEWKCPDCRPCSVCKLIQDEVNTQILRLGYPECSIFIIIIIFFSIIVGPNSALLRMRYDFSSQLSESNSGCYSGSVQLGMRRMSL